MMENDVSYITPASILIVSILLPIVSTLIVTGRFWLRKIEKTPLLLDDWLLAAALVLIWGSAVAQIYSESQGALGYPKGLPPDAPAEEQLFWLQPKDVIYQKTEYIVQLLDPLLLGCIKASFIFFYRRIFCTGHRTVFSIVSWIVLGLVAVWSLSFCLFFILRCGNKFWANWNTINDLVLYCPAAFPGQEAYAITDFIMDITVMAMPLYPIAKLRMSWSKKLYIAGIFMLGMVAIVASTIRMVIVIIVTSIGFNMNVDGDLQFGAILFWSMVEDNAGLIAACLPTMGAVVKRQYPNIRDTWTSRTRGSASWFRGITGQHRSDMYRVESSEASAAPPLEGTAGLSDTYARGPNTLSPRQSETTTAAYCEKPLPTHERYP